MFEYEYQIFKNIPIFVYGSLLKNFWNYKHIFGEFGDLTIIKCEIENAILYHFDLGYPGIYESTNKKDTVKGELIILDNFEKDKYDKIIKNLDYLEEFNEEEDNSNNFYIRKLSKIKIIGNNKKIKFIDAWVFWCNMDIKEYNSIKIENGDWREFMKNQIN
jgi:gamma-glutamylcyclotransferase (GGCT)/AIG2-like uncharacterized protein YtfP